MPKNVDEVQQLGKDSMDMAMKSFGAVSEGFRAIAAEVANYSNRSLEDHRAAMEKLMGAKSPEKAIEIQSEYIKMAYEGFVAQATKIGELYAEIAKASYRPFEGLIGKKTSAT